MLRPPFYNILLIFSIFPIYLLNQAMISKHNYNHSRLIDDFLRFISNRKFQVFLLTLLLGSFLLWTSAYLRTYDPQVYNGVFTLGRRFLSTGAGLQVQAVVDSEQVLLKDDALYCDRSHERTDVCIARGDVRVVGGGGHGRSYEVVVLAEGAAQEREEILKPYTRKWEDSVMKTIDEVKLIRKVKSSTDERAAQLVSAGAGVQQHVAVSADEDTEAINSDKAEWPICEVQHEVPAILFSTGGYTGNVYHEFNDGLIPLFITAQQYPPGQVVLLILEYHDWWMSKYAEIVSQITNYTVIDLAVDKRVHCFPEVTVGLHIHDELAIHAHRHGPGASMQGFQSMLYAAYLPRLLDEEFNGASTPLPAMQAAAGLRRPKLVIISRSSPRALLNEQEVKRVAEEIGFSVEVVAPTPTTEMVDMYRALSRCDVMVGVHGAAMTHVLFMRPGATFIQVVPLGTDWAAATYYGEPAQKLGLNYVAYKVSPTESSLSQKYASDDPVLVSPESVNEKGWSETKRIYLEAQDVTVSLSKMRVTLLSAFARAALIPS